MAYAACGTVSAEPLTFNWHLGTLFLTVICSWVSGDRWVVAFRDALSFRFSHYFICFLSELMMTLTGFGGTRTNGDTRWQVFDCSEADVNELIMMMMADD